MTSQAKMPGIFERSAASFDVHESDYLILVSEGLKTHEDMYFRFPTAADFESFLKHVASKEPSELMMAK